MVYWCVGGMHYHRMAVLANSEHLALQCQFLASSSILIADWALPLRPMTKARLLALARCSQSLWAAAADERCHSIAV
jgi:hypothetical protein